MSFSVELKKRRKALNLSMRGLEEKSGVSDTMLCRYERGEGILEMSFEHMRGLSKALGWDLADLGNKLNREGTKLRKQGGAEE